MKTTLTPGTTPITKRDDIVIKIVIKQGGSEVYKDEHLNLTLESQFVPPVLIDLMSSMTLGENAVFELEPKYFNQHFTEHIPAVPETSNVFANVTVKEVSKVEDLFGDENFFFRIIEKTNEIRDPEATRVKIHYKFEINDMSYIENLEQKPLQVIINQRQVPELWNFVLERMKPGEHARIECNLEGTRRDMLDNSEDQLLNLSTFKPKDAKVGYLYLKAESFDNGALTEGLTTEERNALGIKIKDEGNSFFKAGNFEQAGKVYKSALATLEPFADDPAVLRSSCAMVSGNLSLCFLRLKDFASAEKFATHALEVTPNEPKFLLRRAQAKIGNSMLDSALEDLKVASDHAEEGEVMNSIKKEILFVKQEFGRIKQVEKERFKNLFK
jgi:tetratricopeptide (TPR) repeat protein